MDEIVTPAELARELGTDARTVRGHLRAEFGALSPDVPQWLVTAEQADIVRRRHIAEQKDHVELPTGQASGTPFPHPSDPLAAWSNWLPFGEATDGAPKVPGVYMAREGSTGPVVYIGMAGERRGQGIRGRLKVYSRGRGAASGLGEAAMDRALADRDWLAERLAEIDVGLFSRTRTWATAAVARADLHIRWATTVDGDAARTLERRVLDALRSEELWNRAR